jgi:ABC-type phosphate transport system ATPase subunit
MVDAQWTLRIFAATHIDARADREQVTHCIDPWGCATMEWLKNRMIEKYQDMKTNGKMIATDDEIMSRAIGMVRLI